MPRTYSRGKCRFCSAEYTKAGMTKHLLACKARALAPPELQGKKARQGRLFHLLVSDRYAKAYWMHVEMPADALLDDLDSFLRETWVECCGHLSAFRIGGTSFISISRDDGWWNPDDQTMRGKTLSRVLSVGQEFGYEYDFGTTTELTLSVIAEREGSVRGNHVDILARNDPPFIPCGICGQQATTICMQCVYEETGWMCDTCAKDHECSDEMFLPVVNSPRVGMCGYEGAYDEG